VKPCDPPTPGPWLLQQVGTGPTAAFHITLASGQPLPDTEANRRMRESASMLRNILAGIRDEYAADLRAHGGVPGYDRWLRIAQEALDPAALRQGMSAKEHAIRTQASAPDIAEALETLRVEFEQHLATGSVESPATLRRWISSAEAALLLATGCVKSIEGIEQVFVRFGGRTDAVDSFGQASEQWDRYRDQRGLGASQIPELPEIIDATGNVIAHISYNGRVWPGPARDWTSGLRPLYDNRVAPLLAAGGPRFADDSVEEDAGMRPQ
jgi:hypothetical protein